MKVVIKKAKELLAAGKLPCIIDTMMEVDDGQLVRELGEHHSFELFHVCSYEQCNQVMATVMRNITEEQRDKIAFVINNFRMLSTERMASLASEAIVLAKDADEPCKDDSPVKSIAINEMMKGRKLMKQLACTIRDIRNLGIEVDILEGFESPSMMDIYRMSGTCNS